MNRDHTSLSKQHLLCVMLEDYFHVANFHPLVQRKQWYRFQTRFEENTLKTLDLLDRFGIKATFFVLGWVAEQQPEIVREVARRGHEIASRGLYRDRLTRPMTPVEFRDDLRRTGDALERATGVRPVGFRASRAWKDGSDHWMLDALAEEGYKHDSSVLPMTATANREPWRRFAYPHESTAGKVWEFPVPTCRMGRWLVPIGGGNYFRQLPHTLVKRAVEHWHSTNDSPFVMYFHVWELDPEQPRINAASHLARLRQYRKLDKISWVLEEYFKHYRFGGIADYLNLKSLPFAAAHLSHAVAESNAPLSVHHDRFVSAKSAPTSIDSSLTAQCSEIIPTSLHGFEGANIKIATEGQTRTPVSVVIPCFNEAQTLPYLANTLVSVERALSTYSVRFIFVDDCSTDETWQTLTKLFGERQNCTLHHHEVNRGVAAAIQTGLTHADTDIVCSMDCDCTYDPHELRQMIPLLTDGVDMVTASPYHPQGKVRNVPAWRLMLSRASSFLYRHTLRQRLHTYTSCFRVYRRSSLLDLDLTESGFLGIAEMLGRLDLKGSRIVEHPTTLEVRLFGHSKMKTARTIIGHLKLLTKLWSLRLRNSPAILAEHELINTQEPATASLVSLHHSATVNSPHERT